MRSRWKVVLVYSLTLLGTVGCATLGSQRVPPYPAGDSVAQYLMAGHPQWELASYRIFSELVYPIPDQRSLHVQLDSFSHHSAPDSVDRLAVDLIRFSLSPFDFPLRDWRSGADAFGGALGIGRSGWAIGIPRIPGRGAEIDWDDPTLIRLPPDWERGVENATVLACIAYADRFANALRWSRAWRAFYRTCLAG
jgi:hypothetical protein